MTAKEDTDQIVPFTGRVSVEGIAAQVRRIRTRELILLVRVITTGIGPNISKIDLTSKDQATQSAAVLLAALPSAIDETLLFLREMVFAVNPDDQVRLNELMRNPDLDALFDIIAVIIDQEWDDGKRLLGKVQALIKAQQGKSPTGK